MIPFSTESFPLCYNNPSLREEGRKCMFEAIVEAIRKHDTIILHRHKNPDGDALGSQIGLKHLILENCPGKTVLCVGDSAGRYAFLPGSVMDTVPDSSYANSLAVILDTSGRALISDDRYALAKTTARIDHHLFLEKITEVEVIDPGFESCCGMITALAEEQGWTIPDLAAEVLYAGMVTDSGRFRYDDISPRTFRLAARLLEHSFDTNELYRNLYAVPLDEVRLRADFVRKIRLTSRGVAYIYTTLEEFRALNASFFLVSRGMVSVMADIEGVEIWANFTESEEGVVAELRSTRVDVSPVAFRYGGGGHPKACGATVRSREEAVRMLADLDLLAAEE